MIRRPLTLLACAVLGVTACGGSDKKGTDEQAVRQALADLERAQLRGDAETACEELVVVQEPAEVAREMAKEAAADGEAEAEREAEGQGGEGGVESPAACRRAFTQSSTASRAQVRDLKTVVEKVDIREDRATARVRSTVVRSDGSRYSNVGARQLVRRDGRWRVRISPEG